MMTQIDRLVGSSAFTDLYIEVQQFYATHMQLLDSGAAEEWATIFTENGTFDAPTLPQPTRGRAELTTMMRETAATLADAGEVRRHWHGMIALTPREDDSLHVRCYALVFSSIRSGESRLHRVRVCEDVLVREDGQLRVKTRRVTRDDLG